MATRLVLREAERNLRRKASRKSVDALHQFLSATPILVRPFPREATLRRYEAVLHPKEVPILAAAVEAERDYLVTLDRRHFLIPALRAQVKRLTVLTPGDFLSALVPR